VIQKHGALLPGIQRAFRVIPHKSHSQAGDPID
jgi:hypothetical protein